MPAVTRTLPAASSVPAGTRQRVHNNEGTTTLTVSATGGDFLAWTGNTSLEIDPLGSIDFESDGTTGWYITSYSTAPLREVFAGAPLTDIVGTTQVVLSRPTGQPWDQSFNFSVVGGNLQAIRPLWLTCDITFIYDLVRTGNNQDCGIVFDLVLRSGSGSVTVDLFGNIAMSPRSGTQRLGASHLLGFVQLEEGDIIGVDASDYTGQAGQTDLIDFSLYVEDYS